MSDRERAVEWFEGAEARDARTRRTTVLLQSLERDVSNPHRRGGLIGLIRSVIHLLMLDAYEAGLRDGVKPVRDALEAVGLPTNAGVDGLITHHRANAKLSGVFDALTLKSVTSPTRPPPASRTSTSTQEPPP